MLVDLFFILNEEFDGVYIQILPMMIVYYTYLHCLSSKTMIREYNLRQTQICLCYAPAQNVENVENLNDFYGSDQ